MSRTILNDHPWDEEEVAYQEARSRFDAIAENVRDFPSGTAVVKPQEDSPVHLDVDIVDYVKALDEQQVQATLKEIGLPITGKLNELKKRLAQHLQEERDGSDD